MPTKSAETGYCMVLQERKSASALERVAALVSALFGARILAARGVMARRARHLRRWSAWPPGPTIRTLQAGTPASCQLPTWANAA
jgi:hypothetical protein